jgi:hypothetical protein
VAGATEVRAREAGLDDGGVFDAGDDGHRTATQRAGFNVDVEHAREALRLSRMAARRSESRGSAERIEGYLFMAVIHQNSEYRVVCQE